MDWGRVAVFYDWQLFLERPALAAAAALADPRGNDQLLDVGTGTGALLRELARRADPPRRAIGIDASARMLARVPVLPPGWTVARADARRLPFADGAFSVVTAAYLLHVVDAATRQGIIGDCHRVLRAGGRLVTVTPTRPRTSIGRALYAPLAAGPSVGPAAGLRPLDPRSALEQAGFTIADTRHVRCGYPSLCVLAIR